MVHSTPPPPHSPPSLLLTHGITASGHLHVAHLDSGAPLLEQRALDNSHTLTLLLNRPKALHALSLPMITALYKRLQLPATCFLLLSTPASRPSFSAGGDVLSFRPHLKTRDFSPADGFFRLEFSLVFNLANIKVPVVSILDGIVMGGGVGVAIHGRFRVATERSLFAMPETALGIVPDVGASYFLSRMQNGLGMYCGLTGGRLKGRELVVGGVATHFVRMGRVAELVAKLQTGKFENEEEVGGILDEFAENVNEEIMGIAVMERCFTGATVEEVKQRLKEVGKERGEDGVFAKGVLERFERMCPMSLKLAFESLKRGKDLSLEKCLQMEFRLIARCIRRRDFMEGIEAVLVRKDGVAKWEPESLEGIKQEDVDQFFEPLENDLKIAELMLTDGEQRQERKTIEARL